MNDLRPYLCTFLDCSQALRTYTSQSKFLRHELRFHGNKGTRLENGRLVVSNTCVFCEEVLSTTSLREYRQHVGRHMEEVAFMVVTKPYEDWDFYTDGFSGSSNGTDDPRNTPASYYATYEMESMPRVSE